MSTSWGARIFPRRSHKARVRARGSTRNVPAESGIILPVPEATPVVVDLRWLHDPQARCGVPAHVTLLYPFAHPSRVADHVDALAQLFGNVSAFTFSLTEIRRFPATAYLHPEPSAAFVQLTDALARRWPEFPPVRVERTPRRFLT